MRLLEYCKGLGVLVLTGVAVIIALPLLLELLGFHVFETGGSLAEKLVEQGKPVTECRKLMEVPWNMLGPPASEQRKTCIHTYAKLTKDPTACELLMPSDYGWSCLGVAMEHEPCVFLADGKSTVKGQGIITTYDECTEGPRGTVNHVCCSLARIVFQDTAAQDCTTFPVADGLRDQCHHLVAKKEGSLKQCGFIGSARNRAACEVAVKALQTGSK